MTTLLAPEQEVLTTLRRRIATMGRASAVVLCGYYRAHLDLLLRALCEPAGGCFMDLGERDQLRALQESPPFNGRDLVGLLSDTALRDFLSRSCRASDTPLLAVHIPATIWRFVAGSSRAGGGPGRFLEGLRQWSGSCTLAISYPLEADTSSLTAGRLRELLGEQLVMLRLRDVERRFLDDEEGLVDASH